METSNTPARNPKKSKKNIRIKKEFVMKGKFCWEELGISDV
jgi:hypothetical protein